MRATMYTMQSSVLESQLWVYRPIHTMVIKLGSVSQGSAATYVFKVLLLLSFITP